MSVDIEAIRARAKVGINYINVSGGDWPDSSAEMASDDRDELLAEVDRLRAAITQALVTLGDQPHTAAAVIALREAIGIEVGP